LKALGAWLKINGEAIYGTQPWKRAEGESADGIRVRFTKKDSSVYAILLAKPKANTVTIKSLSPEPGTKISLLGGKGPLNWSQQGDDIKVSFPPVLPGEYAYVLKIAGPVL
jgi:alpha-L-fucosidase